MHQSQRLQRRLYLLSAAIVSVGVGCACFLYIHAVQAEENLALTMMTNSKVYRRGLALYGGTLNVVFDDFGRWFDSLWQGRNLAYSVAVIAVLVAGLVFLVARNIVGAVGERAE